MAFNRSGVIRRYQLALVNGLRREYLYISLHLQQPFVTNQMRNLCFPKTPHFLFNRLLVVVQLLPSVKISVKQHRPLWKFQTRSIKWYEMFGLNLYNMIENCNLMLLEFSNKTYNLKIILPAIRRIIFWNLTDKLINYTFGF